MEEQEVVFWVATLLTQVATVLWLSLLLTSFCRGIRGRTAGEKLAVVREKLWRTCRAVLGPRLDERMAQQLDSLRCRLMHWFWTAAIFGGIMRLFVQQLRVFMGLARAFALLDAAAVLLATTGLVLQWKPGWLNPKSLDAFYMATSLLLSLTLLTDEMDARDALIFHGGLQLVLALLAKRAWCCILCTMVSSAQVLRLFSQQGRRFVEDSATQGPVVLFGVIQFLTIWFIRRLLHENAVLQMDLQKRTLELGTVSSLLLVCYDAVVSADESLTFTEDSPQLSGLLLHTASKVRNGLAGRSLLDLCSKDDHDRILRHFAASVAEGAPVMALHVDMLDSDQNHLKVELVHAAYTGLLQEQCFLIGVREIQYQEAGPWPLQKDHFTMLSNATETSELVVTFDAPSFEIISLSPEWEQLCEQMAMAKPETILDISSIQGRHSFNDSLQELLNLLTHTPKERDVENTLWFDFLGVGAAIASISVEYDEDLETFLATMRIYVPLEPPRAAISPAGAVTEGLTEANVQQLECLTRTPRRRPCPSDGSHRRQGIRTTATAATAATSPKQIQRWGVTPL